MKFSGWPGLPATFLCSGSLCELEATYTQPRRVGAYRSAKEGGGPFAPPNLDQLHNPFATGAAVSQNGPAFMMSSNAVLGEAKPKWNQRLFHPGAPGGLRLSLRKPEVCVGIFLTGLIVCLHLVRGLKAGGLWRGEAASANLAGMFSIQYVISRSQYELVPVLLPAAVFGYCWDA